MGRYILKNKVWEQSTINRLCKEVKKNAEDDRQEAKKLLSIVKNELANLIRINTNDDGEVERPGIDAVSKLVSSACQALNQMGVANERLLKFVQLIHKFKTEEDKLEKSGAPASKLNALKGSLFSELQSFTKEDDEDD